MQDKQNECQPKEIAGNQEDALDYQSISSSLDWIQETESVDDCFHYVIDLA